MSMDSRIPLMGQPVQLDNPLDNAGKGLTLASLMDRLQSERQLRSAFQNVDAQGNGIDLGQVYRASPQAGMQMENAMSMRDYRSQLMGNRTAETMSKNVARTAKATKGLVDDTLRHYFNVLQGEYKKNGGNENLAHKVAEQETNQFYMRNVSDLHQNGSLPSAMPVPAAFQYDAFAGAHDKSDEDYLQAATQAYSGRPVTGAPDLQSDSGQPVGGQMIVPEGAAPQEAAIPPTDPNMQQTGAKVTAPPMPPAPGVNPGMPMQLDQIPDNDTTRWAKHHLFTRIYAGGKIDPLKENNVYDYRNLKLIDNEPIIATKARLAREARSSVNVQVDAFDKKMSSERGKDIAQGEQQAQDMRGVAQQVRTLVDLLGDYKEGQWDNMKAKIGEYLPGSKFAEATSIRDAAEGFRTQLATRVRAPGSGATSDMEMNAYVKAIPGMVTYPAGRELMATLAERWADWQETAVDTKRDLIEANTFSLKNWRETMAKKLPPHFITEDEKRAMLGMGLSVSGAKAAPPPAQAAKPTPAPPKAASKGAGSGTRDDPFQIKGDDGYSALPSGTYFMGPDGRTRKKP